MAYMSQENKKSLEPAVKKVLDKYGIKGRLSVRNHSTLVLNISEGRINFRDCLSEDPREVNPSLKESTYWSVNPYWISDHWKDPAGKFLLEIKEAMMRGNHDRSDIMTDYFDVGWYIAIHIGTRDKPYVLNPKVKMSYHATVKL